jgi:hypothetical protein
VGASQAALHAFTEWQRRQFSKDHVPTEAMHEHANNPLLMAERTIETTKEGFELLMAAIGIGGSYVPGWDIAAQLQWHGALYDSDIPFLDSAATLAISSAWHARAGWTVRAGLVEDAIPRHAQDVTFFIGLSL